MQIFERPETRFAIRAVQEAARVVRLVQNELVSPALTKDDRSPVTVADYASQALIGKALAEVFPNDPLVGEEDSTALRQVEGRDFLEQVTHFVSRFSGTTNPEVVCEWIDRGAGEPADRFWTLDPIDGTKGFLRGEQYAIAFALIVDGKVEIGVLGCPNLKVGSKSDVGNAGTLAVAVRGEGAWIASLDDDGPNLQRVHISETASPAQARVLRSFESGHTNVDQVSNFSNELGVEVEPVRLDSQAKYILLAVGEGELYLRLLSPKQPNYKEKIWDQAAGSLLVEEAGGKVSDLYGEELDFNAGRMLLNNRGILASNTRLHEHALQALKSINA
jgi:3'(2'), 5'-bisphosphate nucleotidase